MRIDEARKKVWGAKKGGKKALFFLSATELILTISRRRRVKLGRRGGIIDEDKELLQTTDL